MIAVEDEIEGLGNSHRADDLQTCAVMRQIAHHAVDRRAVAEGDFPRLERSMPLLGSVFVHSALLHRAAPWHPTGGIAPGT